MEEILLKMPVDRECLTTSKILYILLLPMFCNIEDEKVIPPTKAKTIDAKIPNMDIYSFSIPFTSCFKFVFASSIPSAKILLIFSI